MKLSELVNELTAELIRDGDAEINAVGAGAGRIYSPGQTFCHRDGSIITLVFTESDEAILRQARAEELMRLQHSAVLNSGGIAGISSGRTVSGPPLTTDKHTLKALYDMIIKESKP